MSGSFYPSALLNSLLCGYTCVIWPTYFNCCKTVYCISESQFVFPSFQPRALVCFPCLITNTVSVNTLRRGWLFVSVCGNSLQDKCLQASASRVLCEVRLQQTQPRCSVETYLCFLPSACLTFFFLPHPCPHLVWTDYYYYFFCHSAGCEKHLISGCNLYFSLCYSFGKGYLYILDARPVWL